MTTETKTLIHFDRRNGFRYKEGKHIPLWALLMLPFVILAQPLFIWVRKSIDWKSAWITVLIFETGLFFVERRSLQRGHWVYNEARILGPRIFGVPIEEPLLYYLLSPIIIILIFHGFKKLLKLGSVVSGRKQ